MPELSPAYRLRDVAPVKSPHGKALVEDVMRRLDCKTPRDLARRLGWTGDQERKLYKWHAGDYAPNGPSTLRLLDAAGLLLDLPAEERFEQMIQEQMPAIERASEYAVQEAVRQARAVREETVALLRAEVATMVEGLPTKADLTAALEPLRLAIESVATARTRQTKVPRKATG